tara:strand:+ start:1068 stop:1289 length:222 start_codon:yes stop_codon:yes gene_type:complete
MDKRKNFVRLAENRVNKAISSLKLISNLSNRSLYDYNSEDIKKIISALNKEISNIKQKFDTKKGSREDKSFKL